MNPLLIVPLLLAGAALPLSVSVIATTHADAPTVDVLIANPRLPTAQDGTAAASAYRTGTPRPSNPWYSNVGQAFSTHGEDLGMSAITWQFKHADSQISEIISKGIEIRIYKTSANDAVPGAGDLVATHSGFLPDALSAEAPYLTFSFDEVVTLQANSTYLITFGFTDATGTGTTVNRLTFETAGRPNVAPDNELYQRWIYLGYGNSALDEWRTTPNTGAGGRNQPVFYVQGHAIPEPSVVALLVAPAALYFVHKRKRSRVAPR